MTQARTRLTFPLLRACLKPRTTISAITATTFETQTALAAMLGGVAGTASWLLNSSTLAPLTDWRIVAACVLLGAVAGFLNVYALGWIVAWLGRRLGSSAAPSHIRPALAWGQAPNIVGVAIVLATVLAVESKSPPWLSLEHVVLAVCALWSIVTTLLMLTRVLAVVWWRSIGVYVLGAFLCPLLFVAAFRTFLLEPFSIPAASMVPTLLTGDYVFVSKSAYGYNRYSLPFVLPGVEGRMFASDPQPGDVVVFAPPRAEAVRYIKRVVAAAGDRVQMKAGELYINGVAAQRERLDGVGDKQACEGHASSMTRWRETLPNGVSYETLDCTDQAIYDTTAEFAVPPGHVFVLGDNRDNSADSRDLSGIGYVPLKNVVGRAAVIFFSTDGRTNEAASVRFDRIGRRVR